MPVATLYDVHGNLPALEAVLAQIPDDATIVVGGDVVAGGAQPSETLERLRGLGDRVRWLRGNADRELDVAARSALNVRLARRRHHRIERRTRQDHAHGP